MVLQVQIYGHSNPTSSNNIVNNLWTQSYLVINNANVFIEGMNTKGLSVVGTTLGNQLLRGGKTDPGINLLYIASILCTSIC